MRGIPRDGRSVYPATVSGTEAREARGHSMRLSRKFSDKGRQASSRVFRQDSRNLCRDAVEKPATARTEEEAEI
jgi:hypothetical protein